MRSCAWCSKRCAGSFRACLNGPPAREGLPLAGGVLPIARRHAQGYAGHACPVEQVPGWPFPRRRLHASAITERRHEKWGRCRRGELGLCRFGVGGGVSSHRQTSWTHSGGVHLRQRPDERKPHVRWCGRGDGRNPVNPTRSVGVERWSVAEHMAAPATTDSRPARYRDPLPIDARCESGAMPLRYALAPSPFEPHIQRLLECLLLLHSPRFQRSA